MGQADVACVKCLNPDRTKYFYIGVVVCNADHPLKPAILMFFVSRFGNTNKTSWIHCASLVYWFR